MRCYDISLPLQNGMAPWPGDEPYRFQWNMQITAGANINLGSVVMSVHTGTHADAPFHFSEAGETIDACDLSRYVGPARVIDVTGAATIEIAHLAPFDLTATPRLLFKTGAWLDITVFPTTVPTLAPDVPAYLARQGVVLVGLDVPSVDAPDSKTLPVHHALYEANIAILESLDLRAIAPGVYELIALPLKLMGAEGAPVRAVLRDLP